MVRVYIFLPDNTEKPFSSLPMTMTCRFLSRISDELRAVKNYYRWNSKLRARGYFAWPCSDLHYSTAPDIFTDIYRFTI